MIEALHFEENIVFLYSDARLVASFFVFYNIFVSYKHNFFEKTIEFWSKNVLISQDFPSF